MTDPLAGMSVKEAREFTQRMRESADGSPYVTVLAVDMVRLLALAERGAECVEAREGKATHGTFVLLEGIPGRTYLSRKERVLVLKEDK